VLIVSNRGVDLSLSSFKEQSGVSEPPKKKKKLNSTGQFENNQVVGTEQDIQQKLKVAQNEDISLGVILLLITKHFQHEMKMGLPGTNVSQYISTIERITSIFEEEKSPKRLMRTSSSFSPPLSVISYRQYCALLNRF